MEQRFLNQEELQKKEAEKLPQQKELPEEQSPQTAADHIAQIQLTPQKTLEEAEQEVYLASGTSWQEEDRLRREKEFSANLRQMQPNEREALFEQLTQQAQAQKRRRGWFYLLYMTGAIAYFGYTLSHLNGLINFGPHFPLLLVFGYLGALLLMKGAEKRWSRTVESMALCDDPRASGTLMEALELKDPTIVTVAEKALMNLMPRLQASDAEFITEAQRECLYRRLKIQFTSKEADFQIVALKALEQIGDAKALPCVETLATSRSTKANVARVREAAQACLPFLRERAAQQQSHDSLLRPSSGQEMPSDALLRPAESNLPTDPGHLLRSSSPEEQVLDTPQGAE